MPVTFRADKSPRISYRIGGLLVLLLAWALLLFRLSDVPPGFQHDQTFTAADAVQVAAGRFSLYFTANFGREPLFIYSAAAVFRALGGHFVWSLRFTSVLWGMLAVALMLALSRRYLRPAPALLATTLMTGSFWFLLAARLGLEVIPPLPAAAATYYLLSRACARASLPTFAAAGAVACAGIYSYPAGRALYLLPVAMLGYDLLLALVERKRRLQSRLVTGYALAGGVMLLLTLPLLLYVSTNTAAADRRLAELQAPLAAALRGNFEPVRGTIWETISSLFWTWPDAVPYQYNLPGRPALAPALAILAVVGLVVVLRRWRNPAYFLLLAGLAVSLAPAAVTGGGVLYLRGLMALPLITLLLGFGLQQAMRAAARLPLSQKPVRAATAFIVLGLVVWSLAESGDAYYRIWGRAPQTARLYNADLRAVADFLDASPVPGEVYVSTDYWVDLDQQTYAMYEPRHWDVHWYHAGAGMPFPKGDSALYLMTRSGGELPSFLKSLTEQGARTPVVSRYSPRDDIGGFRLSTADIESALRDVPVRTLPEPLAAGDVLRLTGAGARQHDDLVEWVTRWQVLGKWRGRFPPKVAVTLSDLSGYKWSHQEQAFAVAYQGWQPGDQFLQMGTMEVPADAPPGRYRLLLSVYDDGQGSMPIRRGQAYLPGPPPVAEISLLASSPAGVAAVPPLPVTLTAGDDQTLAPVGRWNNLETVVAGLPLQVRVSWRAAATLRTDELQFRLVARDSQGQILWDEPAMPLQGMPPSWPQGQTYRLTHRVRTPATMPSVEGLRLDVCALHDERALACADLGQARGEARRILTELPRRPQVPSTASWEETVRLAGYDVERRGGHTVLVLYWRVIETPERALQRFVHLVDETGQILAQSDAVPGQHDLAATTWEKGEYIVDNVPLPATAGASGLYVGLYDAETGDRLAVRTEAVHADSDRLFISLPGVP